MVEITIITLCLLLNALLSATETAFVSVGRPELRAMAHAGYPGASGLLALRERPEQTLSVVQLGITSAPNWLARCVLVDDSRPVAIASGDLTGMVHQGRHAPVRSCSGRDQD